MAEREHFHLFEKHHTDREIIHYDVCILGGGPAGLTAAIYSARYGLHTALITKNIGGMANLAEKIENYPGFEGSGRELMQKFFSQAKKFGTEFLNSEVANLYKDKTGFVIELINRKIVHAKTLIIALGTEKRKLNISGEEKFLGRGVSYCTDCDANFFKNKIVAVVGGGDSACKSALLLAKIAKKVFLIYRGSEVRCQEKEKFQGRNIEILYNALPKKIKGDKVVKSLLIEQGTSESEIKVDGIFIEIGAIPFTAITKKLRIKTSKDGFFVVNENMETKVKGIFAAGDAVKSKFKQIIIAASQGAIAARSACDFLKSKM